MLICDECMGCCHIEDHEECEVVSSSYHDLRCQICLRQVTRLYEMEKEHVRELMKKYKKLLGQLDLDKLLDE